jgi:hypothetical protein
MAVQDLQGTGRKKLRWQLTLIVLGMGLLKFIIHMIVVDNYELHRDAYLYLSYGRHPQWGYMSNPPFIGLLSWIALKIFGGGILAVRFFPALASAITMVMVGRLIKALGGQKWAVIIGTVAFLVVPIFLRPGSMYQPVVFDQLFWFMYLYAFVKLLQTYNKNYWFVLGLIAGLGLLNKYTILAPVVLTTFFLLFTRHRKLLWVPQFSGFIINIAILATPNLIWQYNHNWPELNHFSTLRETQLLNMNSGWFLAMQFIMFAPAIIVPVAGLINLFANKQSRPYIALAYSYVAMIAVMLLLHAKPYYPAPFYIVLMVFGAVQLEAWLAQRHKWALWLIGALMIGSSIPLLPLSLPYLNLPDMKAFSQTWQNRGFKAPFIWEDGELHDLPQDYADMTGWRQVADKTADAFQSLSPAEKQRCAIYGENYGKTGAINYYNRRNKEMPDAFCFEGSFMFWSPVSFEEIDVLIYVDEEPDSTVRAWFEEVKLYQTIVNPNFRENGTEIYICRNPKPGMADAYAKLRDAIISPNHRKPFEHNRR